MWTPPKLKILSTKGIIIWGFLLFCDRGLIEQIRSYSRHDTKVIFVRGKPKNTVISKF